MEAILTDILTAVTEGHWWAAVAGVLSLTALLLRRYGASIWAPLGTVPGVVVSTLLLSTLGGLANALGAGEAFSAPLLVTAGKIGLTASGAWALAEWLISRQGAVVAVDGRAVRVTPGTVTGRELREILGVPEGRRVGLEPQRDPVAADDTVELEQGQRWATWAV